MAEDEFSNKPNNNSKETFHRTQETKVEHRLPAYPTGIVPLPRGSRGARSLYLRRNGDSFGFTLRHFIVYPPDSISDQDGYGVEPVETIFVKNVKQGGSAEQAGLQRGNRILAVNNVNILNKTYKQVVQLISNSPEYLHLLVVPKEDDVLQQIFAETAHNPVSNQSTVPKTSHCDILSNHRFLSQRIPQNSNEFQADALSWRSLQHPYSNIENSQLKPTYERAKRSADSLLSAKDDFRTNSGAEIYAEIHPNEITHRQRCRAQPQVPLYKKMGRRASGGCIDREQFDFNCINPDIHDKSYQNSYNMKTVYKPNYLPETSSQELTSLNYPNNAGCRLSLDAGRRESTSSLSSSLADGSKDSLASFDSTSTLTGHETDDSAIMNRLKKNVQRKEEFLRNPVVPKIESSSLQREFYAQPKKLDKPKWPPNEYTAKEQLESHSRIKPSHQNFARVKNDIDSERDMQVVNSVSGNVTNNVPQQKGVKTPKDKNFSSNLGNICEASAAPDMYDIRNQETSYILEEHRVYPPVQQVVHKRAKDFESGRPLPDEDPLSSNRTNFSRSELARLSAKHLVPNVSERAHEYEIRAVEPRRDNSSSSTNSGGPSLRRIQRDSRSLDSSGSNASSNSVHEMLLPEGNTKTLSGNVTISSGSKYIHCPPPTDQAKPTETSVSETIKGRVRSNSTESWVPENRKTRDKSLSSQRNNRQDVSTGESQSKDCESMDVAVQQSQLPYADLPPLIPEPVERIHLAPVVSITLAPTETIKAVRPTQLNLEGPTRPSRHLKPPSTNVDTPIRRSVSPVFNEDMPVVVKRRAKNTNVADDERITRRESYLKATEGGRMHIDSDLSDDGSPQALRSAHRRWRRPMFLGDIQQLCKLFEDGASSLGGSASGNSSSSASLDREKISSSPLEKEKYSVIREGTVHCKILEIDGKRFADRSWKQAWIILKGPKLFLHKDRHHQSPIGTTDSLDHSLATGVDMRTSVVRVAEEYTKRKNVIRVSAVKPCRSEFLLQADSNEEFTDWVKIFQQQVAASTDAELDPVISKQAVPQLVPASTTIQVQGSHLSPQLNKSNKTSSNRNRSPTGQSPVSKSRKPSQISDPSTSPKSKTWRGRMAKQFRKIQGASSPSSPTAPEGSTFGIPLDQCLPSISNPYIPRFVEVCTDIVDERGLKAVGIYRVPGNSASITALTEEINKNYDDIPQEDPRWNDLHVVSSLLKSYFRKLPDSLVTVHLYPKFIQADKHENSQRRMEELRRLVKLLPPHNYHTLKHVIEHLKRVVANSEINRMEAKNLAIVFGPTIIKPDNANMESLVTDMTNQCKIVETLLTHADWFFSDSEIECVPAQLPLSEGNEEFEQVNQELLLKNISKYEALKDPKEKNGALFSSIISAAARVKKRASKPSSSENRYDIPSPTVMKTFNLETTDLKDNLSCPDGKTAHIPTTVTDIEKSTQSSTEKVPWFNYSDEDQFRSRVEKFKQETEAMLHRPRKTEITVQLTNNSNYNGNNDYGGNIQPARIADVLTKTRSASNVYARALNNSSNNSRNSLSSPYSVQFSKQSLVSDRNNPEKLSYSGTNNTENEANRYIRHSTGYKDSSSDGSERGITAEQKKLSRGNVRRSSSIENVNTGLIDLNANGNMKKIKYENENELNQRIGSLGSLTADEDADLTTAITKIFNQKLKETNILSGENLPYVDESPEKVPRENLFHSDKENIPRENDLYKNPSLHKTQYSSSKLYKDEIKYKESKNDKEKDEDTMTSEIVPDNDRHLSTSNKLSIISNKINLNLTPTTSKLKRSESLNKPERTVSPLNIKLKRSESLNKTGDHRLKRSDSLTKNEKTENNINKRRELSTITRNNKVPTKNKRKNGMPDRTIKRRHTVGGTKDPDKVTWLDNKYQEEFTSSKENNKEKNLRTSSPDLSSTRRERLYEINLKVPEDMVVALRQHFNSTRPQSFPEAFKVPLESHV